MNPSTTTASATDSQPACDRHALAGRHCQDCMIERRYRIELPSLREIWFGGPLNQWAIDHVVRNGKPAR